MTERYSSEQVGCANPECDHDRTIPSPGCARRSVASEQVRPDVYVVHTPKGFTESFDARTIETLVLLGLIEHERDDYVLQDGRGNGIGPIHHFYQEVGRA